ncbi:amidohydrolase family protein [Roseibium marinum]|uniref:L-fuconolactonase n=1 Tax=Roseibium marinum TaxID=281252 RepID=A0A2S3V379_9HYPH|nr:amidohydrolase family protein [Roseibium marinum]POF34223.1 L-fuconolactonase [Roseibium marinum]
MTSARTRIDAHQHFWQIGRGDYGWLTPDLGPIYRDFLPADYQPFLEAHGVAGTILVQAAPTLAETAFMLSLAEGNPFIRGVVGWADFESPDAAGQIAVLAEHPGLVGLRPMIQDIADVTWMLCPHLTPAFEAMERHGLTFDALTLPGHLPHLRTLLGRHPGLKTVIDHGSKPDIRSGEFDVWAENMSALASQTQACCKLSGLVTEAADGWTVEDLRPYADHLLATFSPDRLIWGSDWPVCTLAASYADWVAATDRLLAGLSEAEIICVLHDNAVRVYGI